MALRSKENLGILFIGFLSSVLNYILLVKIFSLNSINGFDDYVYLYGTFFIVVNVFTQIVPTFFYSKLGSSQGEILTGYFKILNIIFSLSAFHFLDHQCTFDVFALVLGLTIYNHSIICLTDSFIRYNLQGNFLKGSGMGLIVFVSKLIAFLLIVSLIKSYFYFFLLEGIILSLFIGPRNFFRKVKIVIPSVDLLRYLAVLLGRLLYFIILPWSLYIGAGDRMQIRTSIFLNERLFLSGIGLLITPFIPKLMLGNDLRGFSVSWLRISIYLLTYLVISWVLLRDLDNSFVENYLNGDLSVFLGFVFLMPLHTIISFYSRVSLSHDVEHWKIFWLLSIVLFVLGYVQVIMAFNVMYWFLIIVVIQFLHSKFLLKLIPS